MIVAREYFGQKQALDVEAEGESLVALDIKEGLIRGLSRKACIAGTERSEGRYAPIEDEEIRTEDGQVRKLKEVMKKANLLLSMNL